MTRCVCCPPASGCTGAPNCYVPTTLALSMTIGAFDSGSFTPTPAEEALIASVVTGTYILDWYAGPIAFRHFYGLSFTSGDWDIVLDIGWKCFDDISASSPTMYINALFCNNTSPYLTFFMYNGFGIALSRVAIPGGNAENIVDYCSGSSTLVSQTATMGYRKIQCDTTSSASQANFFVSYSVEA